MESRVYGHFGSAPGFVVLDIATSQITAINNRDRIHQHRACNPVAGLDGHRVDAIVVGGIGGGALYKLNSAGNPARVPVGLPYPIRKINC